LASARLGFWRLKASRSGSAQQEASRRESWQREACRQEPWRPAGPRRPGSEPEDATLGAVSSPRPSDDPPSPCARVRGADRHVRSPRRGRGRRAVWLARSPNAGGWEGAVRTRAFRWKARRRPAQGWGGATRGCGSCCLSVLGAAGAGDRPASERGARRAAAAPSRRRAGLTTTRAESS
jgi:hypothetical protein